MNEDTHEKLPGDTSAVPASSGIDDDDNDEMDTVEPCGDAPSKPLPWSEQISEIDLGNPVQCSSDERDCDVEEVLRRTVDLVVSNVLQEAQCHPESVSRSIPSEVASGSDVGPAQDTIPQISDHLDDMKIATEEIPADETVSQRAATDAADIVDDDDDDDEFGDFGDFSEPQPAMNPVVSNGIAGAASTSVRDVANDEDDDEDDDFGDFEEADFGNSAPSAHTSGFARFDDTSFSPEKGESPEESVAPDSRDSFRNLIAELFAVVDHVSDLVDRPVETGHFQASVHRDIARCEDVDNWPCVLFRYDSSRTRKALLSSLCIDETPVNCPRFAIDCLSNEFLQPVKEPRGGSLPAVSTGDGRELSEKAKEVLSKIPDLSFMKAEVLTFPTTVQAP